MAMAGGRREPAPVRRPGKAFAQHRSGQPGSATELRCVAASRGGGSGCAGLAGEDNQAARPLAARKSGRDRGLPASGHCARHRLGRCDPETAHRSPALRLVARLRCRYHADGFPCGPYRHDVAPSRVASEVAKYRGAGCLAACHRSGLPDRAGCLERAVRIRVRCSRPEHTAIRFDSAGTGPHFRRRRFGSTARHRFGRRRRCGVGPRYQGRQQAGTAARRRGDQPGVAHRYRTGIVELSGHRTAGDRRNARSRCEAMFLASAGIRRCCCAWAGRR